MADVIVSAASTAPALPASRLARFARVVRAGIAGAAATLVDLAVLGLLVSALHVDPRAASVPALLAGGVANFVGNRHFAFRARGGNLARQAVLYTLVEVIALLMNGLLYDAVLRTWPVTSGAYWPCVSPRATSSSWCGAIRYGDASSRCARLKRRAR